jgi:serine protease Do
MQILKAVGLAALSGATVAGAVVTPATETAGRATTVKRAQLSGAATILGGGSRLGISIRDVEEDDVKSARLSSPAGVFVEDVSEASAAEKGGLRKGDVILEFDGERVRSARQLTRLVQETVSGRKVAAIVMRDGQRVTLSLEPDGGVSVFDNLRGFEDWGRNLKLQIPRPVSPAPSTPRIPPPTTYFTDEFFSRGSARLGLTVDSLSPQLADYFGTKQGVLVTAVQDNSTAAKIGLKAGDVITTVNGSSIDDPAELRRRLQNVDGGAELTIGVMRDKKSMTLKGKLEPTVRRRTYRSII